MLTRSAYQAVLFDLDSRELQQGQATRHVLQALRNVGFALGGVSLGPHGEEALRAAGIADEVQAWVDARDRVRFRLREPPAPDMFTELMARMDLPPRHTAAVIGSRTGVQAARKAGCALVLGVGAEPAGTLRAAGAQAEIAGLRELEPSGPVHPRGRPRALPSALAHLDALLVPHRPIVLFIDYDGTLAPIASRPEAAQMAPDARAALATAVKRFPVAIVSGRDLQKLRRRVDMEGLYYAGSHGFEMSGPDGFYREHPEGIARLPALDTAEQLLRAQLRDVAGVLVERKRYALAVHYRNVALPDLPTVEEAVDAALQTAAGLRAQRGKRVIELLPDVDWHKGRAVEWLLKRIDPTARPVYIGDDLSDEEAFMALRGRGTGIVVQARPAPSAATYRLAGPEQVAQFLRRLAEQPR